MKAKDEWVPIVDNWGKVRYLKHKACNTTVDVKLKDRYKRCPNCGVEMQTSALEAYNRRREKRHGYTRIGTKGIMGVPL